MLYGTQLEQFNKRAVCKCSADVDYHLTSPLLVCTTAASLTSTNGTPSQPVMPTELLSALFSGTSAREEAGPELRWKSDSWPLLAAPWEPGIVLARTFTLPSSISAR